MDVELSVSVAKTGASWAAAAQEVIGDSPDGEGLPDWVVSGENLGSFLFNLGKKLAQYEDGEL